MPSTPSGRNPRPLKRRVKTARGRSASSTRWLERHLNDPYVHRARAEGYRSRAAYKLIEIDDRHRFLKRGARVVDLGAAPGGWSQVAAERVGASPARPLVVALDRLDIAPLAGVVVLSKDFLDADAPAAIAAALGELAAAGAPAHDGTQADDVAAVDDGAQTGTAAAGDTPTRGAENSDAPTGGAEDGDAAEDGARPSGAAAGSGAQRLVSVVLSDLAAPTTGHRQTDHLRVMALCEMALDIALTVLAPGGVFLAKVLRGGAEGALLIRLKRHFATVRHVKPSSSRADSAEMYVLARGFEG